jgi:Flp pilus assembly protein TadB
MGASLGWALAVLATATGYWAYGWPGVALAVSVVVFWLLLQFSRALRVMRMAAQAPVGTVPNAVMLHSKLSAGMRLLDVVTITRSLGRKLRDEPETFAWRDESGAVVEVEFIGGRCRAWRLTRPEAA